MAVTVKVANSMIALNVVTKGEVKKGDRFTMMLGEYPEVLNELKEFVEGEKKTYNLRNKT